jgi:hydrogenase nickel incorporation protein HypA/HybF
MSSPGRILLLLEWIRTSKDHGSRERIQPFFSFDILLEWGWMGNKKLILAIKTDTIPATMHELAVTESILEIALRHAQESKAKRITDLYLVIGQLSSIVDDSVQFYWDIVSRDTLAEGAKLHFKRLPARLACLDCGHEYSPGDDLTCPSCHSSHVKVTAGDEFRLDAMDVD